MEALEVKRERRAKTSLFSVSDMWNWRKLRRFEQESDFRVEITWRTAFTSGEGKVFREGEIRLFVGIFGVDVGALSLTEASLSWCSELSTRLETRTKESNMDAKGIGWKPLLLAKTNYRENVATRQQRYP